jgi:hypothetical protein
MRKTSSLLCSSLLLLFSLGAVHAKQRALLYPKSLSGPIKELAKIIRNPRSDKVPSNQLPQADRYFVRIAPRDAVLTSDNKLKKPPKVAVLAAPAKPFVFLTTPESIYGRSLLEIYEDIGYEAESIIRESRNQDMVAILFRYPKEVSVSTLRHGNLPDDWSRWIYPTTWDNVFSLFSRLVQDEGSCNKDDVPAKRICLPNVQAASVLGFPPESKDRLRTTKYAVLKATGGSDWEYRDLLESKLSVFEHFRGNGETQNEVFDPDAKQPGLLELIGPNMKIEDLPEVAIIHLGKLLIEDCYSSQSKKWPKCEKE